jgi:hypothetical protein
MVHKGLRVPVDLAELLAERATALQVAESDVIRDLLLRELRPDGTPTSEKGGANSARSSRTLTARTTSRPRLFGSAAPATPMARCERIARGERTQFELVLLDRLERLIRAGCLLAAHLEAYVEGCGNSPPPCEGCEDCAADREALAARLVASGGDAG